MSPRPTTVLVVDDTVENVRVLGELLETDGYEVRVATSGEQAIRMVQRSLPDLILLDVMMPGLDGYEVCRRLKSDPATQAVPIIFLTALSDESSESVGLDLGAVDYISKPFKMSLVKKRVQTQIRLHQLQRDLADHAEHLEQVVSERTLELINQHQRLEALDRTKSQFLRYLGGEILAPANGLVGIGQLILNSVDDPVRKARYEALFQSSRDRLNKVLEDYQHLVAFQELPPEARWHPVRLEVVLSELLSGLSAGVTVPSAPLGAQERSYLIVSEAQLLRRVLHMLLQLAVGPAGTNPSLEVRLQETSVHTVLDLVTTSVTPAPQHETTFAAASESRREMTVPTLFLEALGGEGSLSSESDGRTLWRLQFLRFNGLPTVT